MTGMKIEILGSGGASATPSPAGTNAYHQKARDLGVPYARTGPSTFIHGPDILIDTPEESRDQLVRAGIRQVAACFYSHWHPDHVMGRRVWESLNHIGREYPRQHRTTNIYLPEQVATDFRTWLGSWEHLQFLESQGYVQVHELTDGEAVDIVDTRIAPFRLAEDYVYGFLVEDAAHRVLIVADEVKGWMPPADFPSLDLAILPIGMFEFHPITGERLIHEDDPLLEEEATFAHTLEVARSLDARRIVLSHIEALDELDHDLLLVVAERLRGEGVPVEIAWDGMIIEV
jgi:phosphoribosyl 1,2-cyclic phosphate phosphodiesterase